jgi:hypothetical protein
MTLVVLVCSPLIVATAKGSGKPGHIMLALVSAYPHAGNMRPLTEDISLVETIGGDDCGQEVSVHVSGIQTYLALAG